MHCANRLLAKMASDFEKPDKIHVLTQDMVPQKLWPLPVGNLFGVGPKSVKRMHEIGIYTIGDLANADADILRGVFGVRGQVFRDYANGIESEPMTRSEVKDNSYGNSVTTPQDLKRPVEADATMLALCESVAGRLRMDGKTARVITVQLVDNAFRRSSHQVTLNSPTNSTDVIYHTARELMRQMWPDRPVRLVGVSAEKTGTDNFEQLDFFTDPAKTDKQEKLDRAAEALRARPLARVPSCAPSCCTLTRKPPPPKPLVPPKARDQAQGGTVKQADTRQEKRCFMEFNEKLHRRIRWPAVLHILLPLLAAFTALMVVGRLISGMHWLSDIIGSILLSAGLVLLYAGCQNRLTA